jgi:hypothetical protein
VALGKAEAQALGMPYIATVIVPHPIGGMDRKEVVRKAEQAIEDMIKVLTMPREKLPERAKEQL